MAGCVACGNVRFEYFPGTSTPNAAAPSPFCFVPFPQDKQTAREWCERLAVRFSQMIPSRLVCELHFEDDCVLVSPDNERQVKADAVPTIALIDADARLRRLERILAEDAGHTKKRLKQPVLELDRLEDFYVPETLSNLKDTAPQAVTDTDTEQNPAEMRIATFSGIENNNSHEASIKQPSVQCPDCKIRFRSLAKLNKHRQRCKKIYCPFCCRLFHDDVSLKMHTEYLCPKAPLPQKQRPLASAVAADDAGKDDDDVVIVSEIVESVRNGNAKQNSQQRTLFRCPVCTRRFADAASLNEHCTQCRNRKSLYCAFCKRKFFNESAVKMHMEFLCPRAPQRSTATNEINRPERLSSRPRVITESCGLWLTANDFHSFQLNATSDSTALLLPPDVLQSSNGEEIRTRFHDYQDFVEAQTGLAGASAYQSDVSYEAYES